MKFHASHCEVLGNVRNIQRIFCCVDGPVTNPRADEHYRMQPGSYEEAKEILVFQNQ